jgi:ferrous iron transport protein B
MWNKGAQYLRKMGGVIMVASIIIWALGYFPLHDGLDEKYASQTTRIESSDLTAEEKEEQIEDLYTQKMRERQEYSYIGRIGKTMEPIWEPLGFDWRAGVSILTGIAAKEIVVSTMAVLYHGDETISKDEEGALRSNLREGGFDRVTAFIFMVFVLLYLPCFAALIAMVKEVGVKWSLFVMGYSTVLAWVVCFVLRQVLNVF